MKKFYLITVILVAIIVVLAVFAVKNNGGTSEQQVKNGTVTLGVGDKAILDSEHDFTLVGVTQDLRCPEDEECPEAGAIAVELLVREGDGTSQAFISSDEIAKNVLGVFVEIKEVAPLPKSGYLIETYQITFAARKASEGDPRQGLNLKSDGGVSIVLYSPFPNEKISSPLRIEGMAPGNWFFEANSPVTLTDWDGKIIAEKYVMAEGDWMTTNMVPFSGELIFEKPVYGERGFLIIQKDNPSGLPEHDDALEIPILFE